MLRFPKPCASGATLALLTALALPAAADQVTLEPTKDGTLYQPFEDKANGAGDHLFVGNTGGGDSRRAVIAFDVSAIQAGSTIDSVTLTLNMSRTIAGSETLGLHRMTADWGEGSSDASGQEGDPASATAGDVTWPYRFFDAIDKASSTPWSADGAEGDYVVAASASQSVAGEASYSWSSAQLTADVRAWFDGSQPQYGWILIGNETGFATAKRFDSREIGNTSLRPQLVIDYTPPPPPPVSGACCDPLGLCALVPVPGAACTAPDVYQGDGSTCDPNLCPQPSGACCLPDAIATCSELSAAACSGAGGSFGGALSTCAETVCPVVLTPFLDALPLPAAAAPVSGSAGGAATYDIAMREVQQQLHNELVGPTTVWGYGDGTSGASYPGPTIEATRDQPVTVNWINDLRDTSQTGDPLRTDHYLAADTCPHGAEDDAKTVVHLHGGHVPAAADGHPELTFTPGNQETYVYPNNQLPATLWYHDHALGITRLNVYMGLAGFYLVRDAWENGLGLPSGEYEIPLAIQDRSFNPDATLKYPASWQDHFFGETMLVNGKVWPVHTVKQGKYRLRALNGCNSRTLTLQFCPGSNTSPCPAPLGFQLLGQEGGLLAAPVALSEITLGPAERADLVVDFAAQGGNDVYLVNNEAPFISGSPVVTDVMKFSVNTETGHTAAVPADLGAMEVLQEGDAVATRTFELSKTSGGTCGNPVVWEVVTTDGLNGTVLGSRWEDVTEFPELGTTEIWSFINRSGMMHPMHMHLVMFQVLDRQDFDDSSGSIVPTGAPVTPPPYEQGWKDTVQVHPGQIVRVIARFEDYNGLFAYHCHILEHEDHEMMREFRAVSCGNAELEPTEECDDGNDVAGDGCYPTCDLEDEFGLYGLAQGGAVDLEVSGVALSVPTTAGQTPDQVALALANAINADVTLAGQGITAVAIGNRVVSNGSYANVSISDPGLTTAAPVAIPALSPSLVALLAGLLLACGALVAGRRQRS